MATRAKKSTAKKVVRTSSTQLVVDQAAARQAASSIAARKTVVRAGPRGFRYGPAYLKSLTEGKGVAVRPANLPKLLSLCAAKGVTVPKRENITPVEIAELVKDAL